VPDRKGSTFSTHYNPVTFQIQKANPDYVNFPKAFLCSLSFLGMYVALYSAQNLQSVLFDKDGYD